MRAADAPTPRPAKIFFQNATAALSLYVLRPIMSALPLRPQLFLARLLAVPCALLSPVAWRLAAAGILKPGLHLFVTGYLHGLGTLEKQVLRYKSGRLTKTPSMVSAIGLHHLLAARTSGRGLLLVTVHSPVLRLLHLWLNQYDPDWKPHLIREFHLGCETTLLGRRLKLQHEQQAAVFGGRLVDTHLDLRRAVRVLRKSGMVLLTQDEFSRTAPFSTFFGRRVRNPLGAIRLAEMTGALILPIAAFPVARPCRWLVRCWPPLDPREGETKPRLIHALEAIFTAYPQAWEWRTLRGLGPREPRPFTEARRR